MSYYLETFGDTYLPTCGAEMPLSLGPVAVAPIPLLGGGAMNPYGAAGLAVRRGGALSYRVTVAGRTPQEMLHRLDEVRGLMGKQDTLTALMPDGSRRWTTALMLDTAGSVTPVDRLHAALTLAWVVLSPYWYASDAYDDLFVDIYNDDDLPILWASGYSLGASVPMPALVNAGNAPVHDITFTITADGGTITSVVLWNTTTNIRLAWTGTLTNTQSLVLDCGARSAVIGTADAYDDVDEPDNSEWWWELAPGTNRWLFRLTGADGKLRVEYASAWK